LPYVSNPLVQAETRRQGKCLVRGCSRWPLRCSRASSTMAETITADSTRTVSYHAPNHATEEALLPPAMTMETVTRGTSVQSSSPKRGEPNLRLSRRDESRLHDVHTVTGEGVEDELKLLRRVVPIVSSYHETTGMVRLSLCIVPIDIPGKTPMPTHAISMICHR